ncbi:MAG: glycoside hydrolase family 43 protein [Acidimicrobiales bacterium]
MERLHKQTGRTWAIRSLGAAALAGLALGAAIPALAAHRTDARRSLSAASRAQVETSSQAGVSSGADLIGSAMAASLPGVASPYYQPAPSHHPGSPARFILTGPDAPDPFMFRSGGTYYLYTSQGSLTGVNVPVWASTTVGSWGPVHDALPRLPSWAVPGFTWAPDVVKVLGGYALYFTSVVKGVSPSMECIGAAFGARPLGPFTPLPSPFICQPDERGSIDPRSFVDAGGALWLYWKSDNNADPTSYWPGPSRITKIWAQRLGPHGRHLLGEPHQVFRPDQAWQGTIVEAPQMVLVQGRYWLFFSANWFNQPAYGIGVASCAGPIGPCENTSSAPWLGSNAQGAGPGEPSVFRVARGVWLLYTPWASNDPRPTPPRPVAMVRIGFGPSGPYLAS